MDSEDFLRLFISLAPVIQLVLHRISHWRTPANWSHFDWVNEERSVVNQSVYQTVKEHGNKAASSLPQTAYFRALSRALTRYRQECRYSSRFAPLTQTERIDESDKPEVAHQDVAISSVFPDENASTIEWLTDALESLPEQDTTLLRKLFWEERTQAEIAFEMHVSQRTVSERRQRALENLRTVLRTCREPFGL
jgi:RNA polymerase sigma factor (sigma-70 family)